MQSFFQEANRLVAAFRVRFPGIFIDQRRRPLQLRSQIERQGAISSVLLGLNWVIGDLHSLIISTNKYLQNPLTPATPPAYSFPIAPQGAVGPDSLEQAEASTPITNMWRTFAPVSFKECEWAVWEGYKTRRFFQLSGLSVPTARHKSFLTEDFDGSQSQAGVVL